jgi:hypothetical protein
MGLEPVNGATILFAVFNSIALGCEMTHNFRVVDVRTKAERTLQAPSPESAAREVLSQDVVRSGSPRDLVARVYWQDGDNPMNMVRLYQRVEDR